MSDMIFCTLFDSYYIDKGIALYNSLERTAGDLFKLYIFCFDDKSYEILDSLNLSRAIIIRSTVLENETMLRLKRERSKAEFCWTCTPQIIEYVLDKYKEDNVIYIDADLYFFSSLKPLYDDINNANANIVITEHRFANNKKGKRMLRRSGKYCVEFNYFDQSDNSRQCLKWWKERCIEWCYHKYEPGRMGDQKYLESFPTMFKGVHELQHLGGGVAPWNLNQYKLVKSDKSANIKLERKIDGQVFDLIFYHFQNIRYIGRRHVNVYSGTNDRELKNRIYIGYLKELEEIRKMLKEYGVSFSAKKKYSSNKIISWAQSTVLRYKIKSFSDIYDLDKILER